MHINLLCLGICTGQRPKFTEIDVICALSLACDQLCRRRYVCCRVRCRFTDCKLHSIDSVQDATVVLRTVASQKLNKILLREYRPHLLASSITYQPNSAEQVTLVVSVFVIITVLVVSLLLLLLL